MAKATKKPKKKQRVRSSHPGVVLKRRRNPSGTVIWRATYSDPDTGKLTYEKLDATLTTIEARTLWAKRKAESLGERRAAIKSGAPRATGADLAETIARYYKAHGHLRPKTLVGYKASTDKLQAWCTDHGVGSVDDLTRPKLMEFRASLIGEKKRLSAPGVKRGKHKTVSKPRSPLSVNRDMRGAKTVLSYLIDLDVFPRLHHDDLRRALKPLPAVHERLAFLTPRDLQKLLGGAVRHDADLFKLTRAEHALGLKLGSTPRYAPIAPLVVVGLITGMRFGELMTLKWEHVDLHAKDMAGNEVGEIHLQGSTSKTKRARTIDLSVSPALKKLLATMHLQSGGKGMVFPFGRMVADAAAKRLKAEYGAPKGFGWQALRRTCGTFLTNSPSIYGAASAFMSARQLGHSVVIAEKNYVGLIKGIDPTARTLEAAMQITSEVAGVIAQLQSGAQADNVAKLTAQPSRQ